MIVHGGRRWGTATELGQALGVAPAVIRNYARRDGLESVRMYDDAGRPEVRYPLDQAQTIERAKRRSGRGRPRVDATV